MTDLERAIEERISQNEEKTQSMYLFGKDITKIPCYPKAILNGAIGGVGASIVTFMVTSRGQLAMKLGIGAFSGVSCVYYVVCRYQHFQQKRRVEDIRDLMQTARELEGINSEEKHESITSMVEKLSG